MRLTLSISDLSDESCEYIESCARIRHISSARLMQRVLKAVCDDQLVLSVLDDDSKPARRRAGEHSKSRCRYLYHKGHH